MQVENNYPYQLWIKSEWYPNNGPSELVGMFCTLEEAKNSTLGLNFDTYGCSQYIFKVDIYNSKPTFTPISYRTFRSLTDEEDDDPSYLYTYTVKDVEWIDGINPNQLQLQLEKWDNA
jgi:hypothetical protein